MEQAEIENPVMDEAMGAELLKAANAVDEGREPAPSSADQSGTRAPDQTGEQAEKSSTPELRSERPRDELGRFTKTEAGEDIPEEQRAPVAPEAPKPVEATESNYVKAQKEQERLGKTWQQVEAEKAAVRAEQERLWQERAQWERERSQPSNGKYAPQEYEELARDCRKKARQLLNDGDIDGVMEQLDLADKAAEVAEQGKGEHYERQWESDMLERMQREPELAKDTPLAREVLGLMQQFPGVFEQVPVFNLPDGNKMGGFSFAVEIAKLRREAGLKSGVEEENKRLKAENEKLRGLTSIDGSGPTSPSGARRFEDMSEEEQEKHLRRASEQVGMG